MSAMVIDREGGALKDDVWAFAPDEEDVPEDGDTVVSFKRFQEMRELLIGRKGRIGVRIAPADEVEALAGKLDRVVLIEIEFPAFRDGRGFSTARLLRERYGFGGDLRAVGDVLEDQIFYMLRCGFSSFVVKAADPLAAFARAARTFTNVYQGAGDNRARALDLRAQQRADAT